MKRLTYLICGLAFLSLIACGGNSSEASDAEADSTSLDTAVTIIQTEGVEIPDIYDTEFSDEVTEETPAEDESDGLERVNYDDVLREYSQLIDSYISLARRAKDGDMEALGEYAQVLTQAHEVAEKLDNAKNILTAEQVAKLNKLSDRLSQAASTL